MKDRIAEIPSRAADVKQLLKSLSGDYLSQVSSVLDEVVFGDEAKTTFDAERQRENLAFAVDVLKKRQAEVAIKRELELRIM